MFCGILKKVKSRKGETFIETLAAILIIALATILFAGFTTTSYQINLKQRNADAEFYDAVSQCESASGDTGGYKYVYVTDESGTQLEKAKCLITSKDGLTSYVKEAE